MAKPSLPDAEFEFDAFISDSSRDKDWVRGELHARIERDGLETFIESPR
jgi:hypothetical protein